jgi:antitoxin ChpS
MHHLLPPKQKIVHSRLEQLFFSLVLVDSAVTLDTSSHLLHYLLYICITLRWFMHTTNLRKVGGSVMLAVPPALLDVLHLSAGAQVGMVIDNGRLVIKPFASPRYTLDELLGQCDTAAEKSAEDRAWLDSTPIGNELL